MKNRNERTGKATSYHLPKRDRMLVITGGGWGDPFERDPQMVLDDVIKKYVSTESARDDYGVIIRKEGDDYLINQIETEKLRKKK